MTKDADSDPAASLGSPNIAIVVKSLKDIERQYGVVFVNGIAIEREAAKERPRRESDAE